MKEQTLEDQFAKGLITKEEYGRLKQKEADAQVKCNGCSSMGKPRKMADGVSILCDDCFAEMQDDQERDRFEFEPSQDEEENARRGQY